jgi:hypothetical protein
MPKNKVTDPITDQEMTFARLVLSGAMTDRQAAETAGLKPDSAPYIKSKPTVRAYMLEHRAAVEQQLVQQEADRLHKLNLEREQVLTRLWVIANTSSEKTRNSFTAQVKALSLIVAMQNLIPDRRAVSEKKSPTPIAAEIYTSAWLRKHQAATIDSQDSPASPDPKPVQAQEEPPADPTPNSSTVANSVSPTEPQPATLGAPIYSFVPDARVPSSFKGNPFNLFNRPR